MCVSPALLLFITYGTLTSQVSPLPPHDRHPHLGRRFIRLSPTPPYRPRLRLGCSRRRHHARSLGRPRRSGHGNAPKVCGPPRRSAEQSRRRARPAGIVVPRPRDWAGTAGRADKAGLWCEGGAGVGERGRRGQRLDCWRARKGGSRRIGPGSGRSAVDRRRGGADRAGVQDRVNQVVEERVRAEYRGGTARPRPCDAACRLRVRFLYSNLTYQFDLFCCSSQSGSAQCAGLLRGGVMLPALRAQNTTGLRRMC